jgi:hypothetical protein
VQVELNFSVASLRRERPGCCDCECTEPGKTSALLRLLKVESSTGSVFERSLKESELQKLRRDSSFASRWEQTPVKFIQSEGGKAENSSRGRESTT